MIPPVSLSGTDLHVSRLSFGTASLHHLASRRRRQDLLAAAFERGFTHFDTAPSYGLGIAELELGRFAKGRRGRITLATKVGLYAPKGSHANSLAVWTRKAAGTIIPALSRPVVDWSLEAAKLSLESSLHRLGVDSIDLLMLHAPSTDMIQADAFLHWLQTEEQKGRIRAWGAAGDAQSMPPCLLSGHPLGMVLQVRDSLDSLDADLVTKHGRDLQFTYGYLSSRRGGDEMLTASEALRRALHRNPMGSVVVSTRQLAHIGELASVFESNDDGNR